MDNATSGGRGRDSLLRRLGCCLRRDSWPLAILLAAAVFRLIALDQTPPGLYFDEGANGVDALRALAGDRPIFFAGNQGREPLFIYAIAASFRLLGTSVLAIRLVSVGFGLLTVAATYLLGRELFGRRVALLATAAIAGSFWHIALSRLGFRAVALPCFEALAAFCLFRGITRRDPRWWAGAGLAAGASMYTYLAARAVPIWLGALAVIAVVAAARAGVGVRRQVLGIVFACVVGGAVVSPLGVYFYRHQDQFFGRMAAASVRAGGDRPTDDLVASTVNTLGLLFVRGDANPRHNIPGRPLFDPLLAMFGAGGVILAAVRVRDPRYALPLVWVAAMLVPGAMAADSPHFLRTSGILPAVYLFPAIGLVWAWDRLGRRLGRLAPALAGAVMVASGGLAAVDYFAGWAGRADVYRAFAGDVRDAAAQAGTIPAGDLVLVSGESYRLQPNPLTMYPGLSRVDRVFDGLRGIVIPADTARARTYLYPASSTRDDGAHCPFLPCFSPVATLPDPAGLPAVGVFRVAGAGALPGAPPRPLLANLGAGIKLTGYEVNPILTPGRVTQLTVHTELGQLRRDDLDWKLFAHLVGPAGQPLASAYGETLAPRSWQPGDRYVAWFDLRVPPTARPGLYSIQFGLFESGSQARTRVTDGAGRDIGDVLLLGPLRLPDAPPANVGAPANGVAVVFSDAIELRGYDVTAPAPGSPLRLTLYWTTARPPTRDYTAFVHVVDGQGRIVAQRDSQPAGGGMPTSVWQRGEVVVDERDLPLPPASSGARFEVVVGLYDASGVRLPVVTANVPVRDNSVVLTSLVLP